MKIKRKIIFFISLMSLFYCVSLMQETYAKYVSSAGANAYLTVARWNVLVNNQDIVDNSNFTDTIVPTFAGTSNIKSGVIAPTAEGSFDITIDGTDTDGYILRKAGSSAMWSEAHEIPSGGSQNSILVKTSGFNYEVGWMLPINSTEIDNLF